MRQTIAGLVLVLMFATSAWAGFSQDPGDGTPPNGLALGTQDLASGTKLEGVNSLELRDVPRGVDGTPLRGARLLQALTRLRIGGEIAAFAVGFQCGDPCSVDPCRDFTVCTVGKNGRTECRAERLIDSSRTSAIQTCVEELTEPQVLAVFGFPAESDMRVKNVTEFAQTAGITADGVLSLFAVSDVEMSVK